MSEEVWMSLLEDERTEFHDRNETGEIHDFCDWIATVEIVGVETLKLR